MNILLCNKHIGVFFKSVKEREGRCIPQSTSKENSWEHSHCRDCHQDCNSGIALHTADLMHSLRCHGCQTGRRKTTEETLIQTIVTFHCPNTTSYIPASTYIYIFWGGSILHCTDDTQDILYFFITQLRFLLCLLPCVLSPMDLQLYTSSLTSLPLLPYDLCMVSYLL